MPDPVAVRVEPLGVVVSVEPGESLIEATWRAGLTWPTLCYGQAECMACSVEVVSGHGSVVPAEDEELEAMRRRQAPSRRGAGLRLACRLRLSGDAEVVVRKAGVRRRP